VSRTQGRQDTFSALERVRQAPRKDRKQQLTALSTTSTTLTDCERPCLRLKRARQQGETWERYVENLDGNVQDLSHGLKRAGCRARPVRRVYIEKVGRTSSARRSRAGGQNRPACHRRVLNAIYEQDFRDFSYGFRPGRSPHQALDALAVGIGTRKVNWVLDADIRKFIGAWLEAPAPRVRAGESG
jgi:RNA-directed DNA polymerase